MHDARMPMMTVTGQVTGRVDKTHTRVIPGIIHDVILIFVCEDPMPEACHSVSRGRRHRRRASGSSTTRSATTASSSRTSSPWTKRTTARCAARAHRNDCLCR